jgi:hypothetical protein
MNIPMAKTSYRSYSRVILFAFILNFQFLHLTAQTEIPDSLVSERIIYIENILDHGKPNANLWWNGWLIGYSVATIGQGVVFLVSEDKNTRQDMVVGAATTLLGAVGQLLTPMVPAHAPDRLSRIPEENPEERKMKLNEAEELLEASALREKNGRSWQVHAVTGVVNIGGGLITWLGFKRTVWAGVANFALNTVITEAQIWTQPTRAMKDYESYCRMYRPGETPYSFKPDISWYVSVYPGGLSMKVVF